jgi:isocitrate lyase
MPQNITEQLSRDQQITALEKDWATNPRWKGIKRGYQCSRCGAFARLFSYRIHIVSIVVLKSFGTWCTTEPYVNCLGALDRRPGHAASEGQGVEAIYSVRLASCR